MATWNWLAAIFSLVATGVFGQQVRINEIMASNDGTISDGTGANHDWVELHNGGASPLDLNGYFITDDQQDPMKFQFNGPAADLTIPAGGFLVLWASGLPQNGPLHLNFKLSGEGEGVFLFAPDVATQLDAVVFGPQLTDVSFGRETEGSSVWRFLMPATPNASNGTSTAYLGFLAPPVFGTEPGFHATPLQTTISAEADAQIWYTLDGSDPMPEAAGGIVYQYKNDWPYDPNTPYGPFLTDTMRSHQYTGPVSIANINNTPNKLSARNTVITPPYHMPSTNVRKGQVLRARAFRPGYIPSRITTGTYVITSSGANPFQLPVLHFTASPDKLFEYSSGLLTAGVDFENWRASNPGVAATGNSGANWTRDTEFGADVEYIEALGLTPAFRINAGFGIHGRSSSYLPRKSLRLYFRGSYGTSTLEHPIIPGRSYTDHKRLIIRCSGSDQTHTNLRDWTLQDLVGPLRFDTQKGRSVVLFINGEFWGVHQVIEKLDRHYLERVHGLMEGEIDLLEANAFVEEGNAIHYNALLSYLTNNSMVNEADYAFAAERMDMENYIDYQSSEIYIGNVDWPRNNVKQFRKRTSAYVPNAPYAHDGRWRWILYDTDNSFHFNNNYPASYDFLARAKDPAGGGQEWSTRLFRRLLLNPRFKQEFITRHADLLNTAFRGTVVTACIDEHKNAIAPDMNEHFPRWVGSPGSLGNWNTRMGVMYTFKNQRTGFARQQVLSNFNLPAMHVVTIDVSHTERGRVRVNTIELSPSTHGVPAQPYPWTGTYFEQVPVTLTAIALPGYAFSHWEGDASGESPTITLDLTGPVSVTAVFVPGAVCDQVVLHYWTFNMLDNGPLESIVPDYAVLPGGLITYPGTGGGYMDRTNASEGTDLNALDGVSAERALRVRNPSDSRALVIKAPMAGHRDASISFATMRTSSGADLQAIDWTVDPDLQEWRPALSAYTITENWVRWEATLTDSIDAMDSPHLAFRIRFLGANTIGSNGNCRFDNLLVSGKPVTVATGMICNGTPFAYNGTEFMSPGEYLVTDPAVLDCGFLSLLRVGQAEIATGLILNGETLESAQPGAAYQWVRCDQGNSPIAGATNSTYVPVVDGAYAVQVSMDGCTVLSDCQVMVNVGLNEHAGSTGLSVLPNPTSSQLFVSSGTARSGDAILLVNSLGAIVWSGMFQGPTMVIDMAHLPPGGYVLTLQGTSILRERIVKF